MRRLVRLPPQPVVSSRAAPSCSRGFDYVTIALPPRVQFGGALRGGKRDLVLAPGSCHVRYRLALVHVADVVVADRMIALVEAVARCELQQRRAGVATFLEGRARALPVLALDPRFGDEPPVDGKLAQRLVVLCIRGDQTFEGAQVRRRDLLAPRRHARD